MNRNSDAFGQSLWDAHRNGSAIHVIERDDGMIDPADAAGYLQIPRRWPSHIADALRHVRGRVLDLGCGAGRHAIFLQRRGHDVLGIDESPLAIRTARARGLRHARVLAIEQMGTALGRFDTLLMLGHNFGLLSSRSKARRLLRRLYRMTAPDARIIAESNDIYQTSNPVHLAYQRHNRRRGRMSGQIRFRVRYRHLRTRFIDYLMVSPAEMRQIVAGTGWRIVKVLPSKGSSYVGILAKHHAAAVRRT
jgi:SAM-dependent methyltransferase